MGVVSSNVRQRYGQGSINGADKFIPKSSHAGGAIVPSAHSVKFDLTKQEIVLKKIDQTEFNLVIFDSHDIAHLGDTLSLVYAKNNYHDGICVAIFNHTSRKKHFPLSYTYISEALGLERPELKVIYWAFMLVAIGLFIISYWAIKTWALDISVYAVAISLLCSSLYIQYRKAIIRKRFMLHLTALIEDKMNKAKGN
jgi:hypothetical protein